MNGLLSRGRYITVPGVEVVSPGPGAPLWVRLDPGDYRQRRAKWVQKIIVHTTKGKWPQHLLPGVGPAGREKVVADFWRGDPTHSAAQIVIGSNGKVACLCDLALVAAYHATVNNDDSVGIEVYQEANGGIFEAALASLGRLVPVLADVLSIPFQIPTAYTGKPMARLARDGGPDCVGIFGHRDNTDRRGRGDPGDLVFAELEQRGAERLDFNAREDLRVWTRRQQKLKALGQDVVVDGIAGPGTLAALENVGFRNGRELDAAVELPG